MPGQSLLAALVLTYVVALILIVTLARMKVPSVVAFILAGTVAGPAILGIVQTEEEVDLLAEIGIVLLLFTVGLDFSLGEIQRIWKRVLFGGLFQIAGTAGAALILTVVAVGQNSRVGIFIGLFVALSSTAIVLKELGQRNQLDSPHGRVMIGILLFQDLCIVALLLLVPILAGQTALAAVPSVLARAILALGTVALVSRLVLPPLLRLVMRSGRQEAFPLAVVLASIGTAWFSSLLGVSMALGAFLGGLVLAQSEFSHQAHAEIRPLRDMLAGLFFISLGMLADPIFIVRTFPVIVAVTILIVILKAMFASLALLLVATPVRVSVTAGVGLSQVGEFSFILGQAALEAGVLPPNLWQTLLAASIATMVVTPALIATAPRLGVWVANMRRRRQAEEKPFRAMPHLSDHVIILGFGVGGQLLARGLRDIGASYLILELNGSTVRQAKTEGEPIYYADATNPDALRAARIEAARAVVGVLSDPDASRRAVAAARSISSTVPIVLRTRYNSEAARMEELGATIAVAEELEASLEVLAQLMLRLHVPGNIVEVLVDTLRQQSAKAMKRPTRAPRAQLEMLPSEIRHAPIATHKMGDRDWSVNRTLADINLRAETGASVLAVQRGSEYVTAPPADFKLADGDVLYLLGDESDILLARARLTAGGAQ